MREEVKLTIGIPVYNGAKTIRATLDSIIPQLIKGVEIIVCDNSSQDSTADIVREYQDQCKDIRYFCNERNLGYDRNVDLVVKRSYGRYVWFCSSNDIIVQGAVNKILTLIESYSEIGVFFVNYHSDKIEINCNQNTLCKNGDDFFRKTNFKNGLISCNIVKKSLWELIDVEKYIGSGWIHYGFLIEALSKAQGYIICDFLVEQIPTTKPTWGENGSFIYVGLELVKIFQTMHLYGYNKKLIRKSYLVIKGGYLVNIPLAKSKGINIDINLLKDCIKLYHKFPTFWLLDLPLMLVPNSVYNLLYKLHIIIKKFKQWNRLNRL